VQGRNHPQLAFKVKSRRRRLLVIHYLDSRFRGNDDISKSSPAFFPPLRG
jgi:hypothetical protein